MNLTWKSKALIILSVSAVISLLCVIIKHQYDLLNKSRDIEKSVVEFKNIGDDIVRNQSKYADKDQIESLIKSNHVDLDKIKQDLDKLGASVNSVSVVTASSKGYSGNNIPSSRTEKTGKGKADTPTETVLKCKDGESVICPKTDPFGYTANKQFLSLKESFGSSQVPIGEVGFDASLDKPWAINLLPRDYKVITVLGLDESGRNYAYSKFNIQIDGKTYPISIKDAQILQEYPKDKLRFNLYPFAGINFGTSISDIPSLEIMPSLELFLFSYSKTKINPDWVFLGLGVGYETQSQKFGLTISPFEYNIAKQLPLLNNMYIGTSSAINSSQDFSIFFNTKFAL